MFFDAGERQWWGRYLEAAPVGWAGSGDIDPRVIWSGTDPSGVAGPLSTGTGVGWGWLNTRRIIEHYPVSAAWMAASFRGGGFTDWFLPSKDELDALYTWCRDVGRDGVFWSSSVYEGNGGGVWTHDFSPVRPAVRPLKQDGPLGDTAISDAAKSRAYPEPEIETGQPLSVRPIRAF